MNFAFVRHRVLPSITVGLLLLLVARAVRADALAATKPNVILIVIDDLGWADLNCYGSKFYRTPNIDQLAAGGMRFSHAYAACPVCSPTRAALLTGKYPARLHLTDFIPGSANSPTHRLLRPEFRQELPLEEVTIAELLRDAGYATAAIGKWHLGGQGFESTRQGFQLGIGGIPWGSVRSQFAPYLGREGSPLPGLEKALPGEYLADRLTSEAEKFIEANRKRPFFLYLSHYSVHTPINARPELIAKYEKAPKPPGLQKNPTYAAMVESVDTSVGRIMSKLESLKLTRNTLVIFTSDNGGLATGEGPRTPATNNAPLREGKGYLYEGGIRVNLIARWPARIKPHGATESPASSCDLLPTIAEACGAGVTHPIDGVSLLPLLAGGAAPAREALYWHYPHYSPQGGKPGGAVLQGEYKLIEFYEQGRRELYNLVRDVSEATNLVDREPALVESMAARLAAWRKDVDAQTNVPNPDYVPPSQADDGSLTLEGADADVHGVMIRHEPLPHKNTIGFWVRADDWVSWDLQIDQPGEFRVEILSGCGTGSGGSQVEFRLGDQAITIAVQETGGFQKFVASDIGAFKLDKAGRYTLAVKALTKPGPAVMDLRQVRLLPVR